VPAILISESPVLAFFCAVSLMLKKQATSAEDPEQEDEDAAGVTSVEEIGA